MKLAFKIVVLVIILSCGCKPYSEVFERTKLNIQIDSNYLSNNKIERIIKPYKEGLIEEMSAVIGHSTASVEKNRPSSALGNFLADAILEETKEKHPYAEICLLNYGGIRSTIDSGNITIGDIFEVLPFENEIVLLKLPSEQISELISFIKSKGGEPFTKELITLKKKSPYWVVTNDYMANGGDDYSILKKSTERIDTGIKLRDAIISYIQKNKVVKYDFNKREL